MTDEFLTDDLDHDGTEPTGSATTPGAPAESDRNSRASRECRMRADGEMVRQAYEPQAEDDGTQAGTLVRDVFDDAARDRFVDTVAGALSGVRDDVLQRALRYWHNVDETIGRRIADQVEPTDSTLSGSTTDPEAPSRSEEVTAS